LRRWQDDTTLLTCQQDGFGVELCLCDCPLAYETGVLLPPLAYLPRGPQSCALGTAKTDLLRAWKVDNPVLANGALVLAPKAPSPFDALLVWFDKDHAVRIVARHKGKDTLSAAEAGKAVSEAWGKEVRQFGWPWRQDVAEGGAPQGWTSHDDRTRVRIFWEQGNDGVRRVFTEWRHLAHP
jgi:hypothetical protein